MKNLIILIYYDVFGDTKYSNKAVLVIYQLGLNRTPEEGRAAGIILPFGLPCFQMWGNVDGGEERS